MGCWVSPVASVASGLLRCVGSVGHVLSNLLSVVVWCVVAARLDTCASSFSSGHCYASRFNDERTTVHRVDGHQVHH